jgi:anaerobic ribonucleoside-triphosphate reductase activating protein
MKIHQYIFPTTVNGPGLRFALCVQGCSRNCEGCFNPETHSGEAGCEISVDEIINLIPREASGITISGGEPFEQIDELAALLKLAKMKKLHSLIYTGFCYEELKAMKNKIIDESLVLTDMLIDGKYDSRVPQIHPLSGSGNQRVLLLEKGNIVQVAQTNEIDIYRDSEFIIDHNGNITATGFIDSKFSVREL